jgi:hypothetical protein
MSVLHSTLSVIEKGAEISEDRYSVAWKVGGPISDRHVPRFLSEHALYPPMGS